MKDRRFPLASFCIAMALAVSATATCRASSSVMLTWTASTDPNVAGYRIYYGTTSGIYTQEIDVGGTTSGTVANLCAGMSYYFAVTAYDPSDLESPPSNEVSMQTPTVSVASIDNGLSANATVPLSLSATASETGGSIASIAFYYGATLIGTSSGPPYSLVWNGAPLGNDVVTVVATDSNGCSSSTTVTVNVVPFGVTGMQFMQDGSFQLSVTGAIGRTNSLYYSTDLQNWTLLTTETNTTGTLLFNDPGAQGSPSRFYKVSSN